MAGSTICVSFNLAGSARVASYLYMTLLVTRAYVVSALLEHFEGGFEEFGIWEFQRTRRVVKPLTLDAERAQTRTSTRQCAITEQVEGGSEEF